MTTASEVISLAYREANFKASEGALTTTEQTEGLTLLQSIVSGFHGRLLGVRLIAWPLPTPQKTAAKSANYPAASGTAEPALAHANPAYPPQNARLLYRDTADWTAYLQYEPDDGALVEYVDSGHSGTLTLDANGALFGASGTTATLDITPADGGGRNTPRRWVYRGDLGAWLEMTTLALTSDLPFPIEFDDFFITALAIRLTPRFGQEPRQITVVRYQEMTNLIKLMWQQSAPGLAKDIGVPTKQTYERGRLQGNFASGGL